MNNLNIFASVFAAMMLGAFLLSGFFMGKNVKNSSEFDKGGKNTGALLVAGSIIGTLVGGSSTVGTAQLAFTSGFSALWFTLGSAMGCVLLAVFLAVPLRKSGCSTVVGIVTREYGQTTGIIAGILSSFGLMINLIAQILAANAILSALFPLNFFYSSVISALMMFLYVFGGVKGTGYLGVAKTVLLYITVAVSAITCLILNKGVASFIQILPAKQYFNLISRGAGIDLGAGLSVALGVICTQTYAASILSAKDDKSARGGALLSALIIPFIGIGSLLIGYFMRINFPEINPSQAFGQFIMTYMPPFVSQLMLVALLITVIGTGAGISLGLSATLSKDLIKRFLPDDTSDKKMLFISRSIILLALFIALFITQTSLKSTILTWGFMSMGLRAVVLMLPMLFGLFLPKRTSALSAIMSASIGLVAMMLVFLSPFSEKIDPLIIGMGLSCVIYLFAIIIKKKDKKGE